MSSSPSLFMLWISLTQVQHLAVGLAEPHSVHSGPFPKLVQVQLPLVSSANLLRVRSIPLSMSLMKTLKSMTCHKNDLIRDGTPLLQEQAERGSI